MKVCMYVCSGCKSACCGNTRSCNRNNANSNIYILLSYIPTQTIRWNYNTYFYFSCYFPALHALSYFSMYVVCIYICLLTICCNMTALSHTNMLLARRLAGWWVVVSSQRQLEKERKSQYSMYLLLVLNTKWRPCDAMLRYKHQHNQTSLATLYIQIQ